MKNIYLKINKFLVVTASVFAFGSANAQLGQYTFTGTALCPFTATSVTTQPTDAVFSAFTTNVLTPVGLPGCAVTANVFNNAGWETAAVLNLAEYNEFTITPNSCVLLNLTSLTSVVKLSGSTNTATLTLRSSVDSYAADLAAVPITSTLSTQTFTLPASFLNVASAVTFRFYITSINAATTTFRQDDVTLIGTTSLGATGTFYTDADGDGFGNLALPIVACNASPGVVANSTDCNDADALIGAGIIFYQDSDGDTYGNPMMTQTACTAPVGYVTNNLDCNDANNLITVATQTFYADADGDTYGNPSVTIGGCTPPVGYVFNNQDCNDANPLITSATQTFYADVDGDGFGTSLATLIACTAPLGYVAVSGDCNDNNNTIYTGAIETCDGLDNDCNGTVDDNVVISTWYQDLDGDTFGNPSVSQALCSQPVGYVLNNTDCNDANAAITIASTMYYQDSDGDGFGNALMSIVACTAPVGYVVNNTDCNDALATVTVATTFYTDSDGDGFGNLMMPVSACVAPVGAVTNSTDCNDALATVFPGATEIADNGIDEDCNGSDLSLIAPTLGLYEFTAAAICPIIATAVTAQPADAVFSVYSNTGGTCSATVNVFSNSAWNTTATIDLLEYNEFTITPNSCKSLDLRNLIFTHKNSTSGLTPTILVRSSLDSYGANLGSFLIAAANVLQTDNLVLPAAFAAITSPVSFRFYLINMATTGATYRQDDVTVKGYTNSLVATTFYTDADGDGFGNLNLPIQACAIASGIVANSTDCNDASASVNPNTVWYSDIDGDGFGSTTALTQCLQPVGYVSASNDCNDNLATVTVPTIFFVDNDGDGFGGQNDTLLCAIAPGFSVTSNDCNDNNAAITTQLNTYYLDTDNDGFGTTVTTQSCTQPAGYATNPLDCNDNNAAITLGTRFYLDTDGDGFGGSGASIVSCTLPVGYATDSTDCNNTNPAVNPGAIEIASNGIDDNCDGIFAFSALSDIEISSLNVYPNPGKNELTISFSNSSLSLEIYTAEGKLVMKSVLTEVTTLNTASFESGVYVIKLQDGDARSNVRWIKM